MGVLAGLFWFQAGAGELTTQSALDVGGLLFFEVLFLSFSSLFQAIFNYPPEFNMVVKERQSGMYRLRYVLLRKDHDSPQHTHTHAHVALALADMGSATAACWTGGMNEKCNLSQL